tara:strand:+ start:1330 stop:1848 length:519 start_codon:yes stop_codon:yes gene_type:complete
MAGGLFGRPFVFNVKCVLFSLLCTALFLYSPTIEHSYQTVVMIMIIFILSYIGMAWYDYIFDCSTLPLRRGSLSIMGLFKPPAHQPKKQIRLQVKSTPKDISVRNYLIALSHILFIGPLILYVSINGNKTHEKIYILLGSLAILTVFYHGVNLLILTKEDTKENEDTGVKIT